MTWADVTAVLLLSALSFGTTAAGVALALRAGSNDRAIAAGMGFSAGIMVLVSALELLPESADATGPFRAAAVAGLGAAIVWLAHRLVPHVHLVAEEGTVDARDIRAADLIIFGLVLHDVPEGFAMANAYIAAPAAGVVTAVAIALHNVPEEFAMALPAVAVKRRRLLYGAALLSALAEPVGAVIGLIAVGVAPELNGGFLALAAGAMLFVSAHELLPMARRYRHDGHVAAGAAASVLAYTLLRWITNMLVGARAA
jgi:ZIP family zinc transporter